jgi:drug/metabolite transporter (DMT)-like permease
MTRVKNSSDGIGPHLALITVQILFGTWPIFSKVVLRSMSPSTLVALRLTGAALAFTLLQRKLTPLLKMPVKDLLLLALCSMLVSSGI